MLLGVCTNGVEERSDLVEGRGSKGLVLWSDVLAPGNHGLPEAFSLVDRLECLLLEITVLLPEALGKFLKTTLEPEVGDEIVVGFGEQHGCLVVEELVLVLLVPRHATVPVLFQGRQDLLRRFAHACVDVGDNLTPREEEVVFQHRGARPLLDRRRAQRNHTFERRLFRRRERRHSEVARRGPVLGGALVRNLLPRVVHPWHTLHVLAAVVFDHGARLLGHLMLLDLLPLRQERAMDGFRQGPQFRTLLLHRLDVLVQRLHVTPAQYRVGRRVGRQVR
mmetsp:Transcript_8783/g.20115  ORF Transcript_8783/g.20115 Transcript_8783/m.20115 type:complete len:278 (-) Transcript_8783:2455-3288(-)